VGTEGGLGETEGAGTFVAGERAGGAVMFYRRNRINRGQYRSCNTCNEKDENSERGLRPLDDNI